RAAPVALDHHRRPQPSGHGAQRCGCAGRAWRPPYLAAPRQAPAGGAALTVSALAGAVRPPRGVLRRRDSTRPLQSALDRCGLGPVAGVDEAGRGACAGPLVVAACVLRPGDAARFDGLNDSKLLTAAARDHWYDRVRRRAVSWSVVVIPPAEID